MGPTDKGLVARRPKVEPYGLWESPGDGVSATRTMVMGMSARRSRCQLPPLARLFATPQYL